MAASDEMSAFARIVDLGSFARAADDLRVTPSALSKLVSRLEDRLGVRLLNRTTRRLALTAEGDIYLARVRDILSLVESAEAEVTASRKAPKGHLRVNTGTAIANRISEQAIPDFLARYPEISIDLTVADRIIDPVAENVDLVLRTGELADSVLVARKLADLHRIICAAPAYLERHGTPKTPAELLDHNCLTLSSQARFNAWPFSTGEGVNRLQVTGNFSSDNVSVLLRMALQGQGIIRLANFVVGRPIREGLLVALLNDAHMSEPVPLWALMPTGRHRAPRVQAFVEFMADRLNVE
jgi:DNA-binding transcriptional LysR family regulator